MSGVLEPLVKSPRLPQYVDELQRLLTDERARRERFYEQLTEDGKAEFINGEVIVQSPATHAHGRTVRLIERLLGAYVDRNRLGFVGGEHMLIALSRNDYEPDICFFGTGKASLFEPRQLKFPPPDFIVEVLSPSTEQRDRGIKFEDYAANGISEYWLVDPHLERVEIFLLVKGKYELVGAFSEGTVHSEVVSGFKIPVRAMFDEQINLETLTSLLTAPGR